MMLYIFRFLHQTTTSRLFDSSLVQLYIFRFLHQTTTVGAHLRALSKLYIFRFLHQTTTRRFYYVTRKKLYIFRFLHQTTTWRLPLAQQRVLYIFRFLHQTTTSGSPPLSGCSCISFVSYIKPQHFVNKSVGLGVVYLSFPTSNHNLLREAHQFAVLYIFRFLHQTTTWTDETIYVPCCISFVSYIKPQPGAQCLPLFPVVYLSFPTSNHNCLLPEKVAGMLYIFRFLHQTTTPVRTCPISPRCISFVSYIKPQLACRCADGVIVVYLSFPTSNHNLPRTSAMRLLLYIFRFLHQTTTLSQHQVK